MHQWMVIIGILILLYVITHHLFLICYIPTDSMEPTIERKSFVVGIRFFSGVDCGDIIVFNHEGRLLVKRIAAVPGDELTMQGAMDTGLVESDGSNSVVPEDCYFVLGDNKVNSLDSRYWSDPYIKTEDIVAKIITR